MRGTKTKAGRKKKSPLTRRLHRPRAYNQKNCNKFLRLQLQLINDSWGCLLYKSCVLLQSLTDESFHDIYFPFEDPTERNNAPRKKLPLTPDFQKTSLPPLSNFIRIRLRNSVGSVTSNALLATAPTAALVPPSLPPPCPTMRPIRSDRYRSPPYNLHRLMTSITLLHGRSDRSRPPRLFPPRPAYTRRDFAPDPSLAPPLPSFEFSQLFRPPHDSILANVARDKYSRASVATTRVFFWVLGGRIRAGVA